MILALWVGAQPLAPTSAGAFPAPAPRPVDDLAFFTRVAANQSSTLKRLETFCFHQKFLMEKLSGDGDVQRREQRVDLVCHYDGVPLYRFLVISGKPTGARDSDPWPGIKRDENWRKQVNRAAERRERFAELLAEIPKAFTFTEQSKEIVDGIPTTVYLLRPKPGYKPISRTTEMLKHVTGRIWIHHESAQLVRLSATVEEDFNLWGGLALKVYKGATYEIWQRPIKGVWLPVFAEERWRARIGLIKTTAQHQRTERYDFFPNTEMLMAKTQ